MTFERAIEAAGDSGLFDTSHIFLIVTDLAD